MDRFIFCHYIYFLFRVKWRLVRVFLEQPQYVRQEHKNMADRIPGAAWPGKKAPGGLEVLEVLVGTTHNSTSQGSLWNRSTSSVTFLSLVLAPFSGCKLRWLLTYKKKLSILVQDWTEKAFYRNLGECALPEGRLHKLHVCISHSWSRTK